MDEKVDLSPISEGLENAGLMGSLRETYLALQTRRRALGLQNPGTVDNIAREVQKDVFLTNSMFTGLRADITKAFSMSPVFQVSHAFAMGSQALPPYTFATLYGTPSIFLQGNIDSDGQLTGRTNYRWTPSLVTKVSTSIAPGLNQAMVQLDNEYTGADFTASLKSINPSMLDGGVTGTFIGSYLQSVTPGLALGLETLWQRPALNQGPDTAVSYCAKYRGKDWVASGSWQAQGALVTSYWKRLTEKVEAGVDLNLQFMPGMGGPGGKGGGLMMSGIKKEGQSTAGIKYDFRTGSTFRAQVDSTGRVSCLLDKRVGPMIQLSVAAELDHGKQQGKVGLAVSIESAGEEMMESQERLQGQNLPPPPY